MVKESKQNQSDGREKFDDLMNKMSAVKQQWDDDAGSDEEEDVQGHLLSQAIEMAIEQGRGWSPRDKEAYLETILDDEYVRFFCRCLL